jgi:type IV pilus assembly protein PilW
MTGPYGYRQSGVSLIELMIAMTLGLVLIIAIGSVFVSSRQTYRTQEGFSQLQENGRFAHYLLTAVIRNTGYLPVPREHVRPSAIFGSDDYRVMFGWESASPVMSGIAGASDAHDAISVSYGGSSDGSLTDCFGTSIYYSSDPASCVATAAADATAGSDSDPAEWPCQLVSNTLYLNNEVPRSLMCKSTRYNCDGRLRGPDLPGGIPTNCVVASSTPGPQPFIQGVADLQFRYGIDTNNDLSVDQWLDADEVTNWSRVLAVEFTVVAESVDAVERTTPDSELVVDGRLRRSFSSTIAIRNRISP